MGNPMSIALIVTPFYGHTAAAYYLRALLDDLGQEVTCFDLEYGLARDDPGGFRLLKKLFSTYDVSSPPHVDFVRRPKFVLRSLFPRAEWGTDYLYSNTEQELLESVRPFIARMSRKILNGDHDVLLFPVLNGNLWFTLLFVQALRGTGCRGEIIVGGEGVSHPRVADLIRSLKLTDHVVEASHFEAFSELIGHLGLERIEAHEIQGMIEENGLYPSMDGFPEPGLTFRSYWSVPLTAKRFIPVTASFGCRHSCDFCSASKSSFYVRRSVPSVVQEIREQIERYGYRILGFCDANLNSESGWLHNLCKTLLENKIKVWFMFAHLRADKLDGDTIRLMGRCGFRHVNFGVESLDEELCRQMHKAGHAYEQNITSAIHEAARAGIPMSINLFSNYPGLGEDAFQSTKRRTVEFIDALSEAGFLDHILFNIHPTRIDPHSCLYQSDIRHKIQKIAFDLPASLAHLQEAVDAIMESYTGDETVHEARRFKEMMALVEGISPGSFFDPTPETGLLTSRSRLRFDPEITVCRTDTQDGYRLFTTNLGQAFRVNELGADIFDLLRQRHTVFDVVCAIEMAHDEGEGLQNQVEQIALTLLNHGIAVLEEE